MSYKPQIEFSSKTYQPLNLLQDEQQKKTIKPKTQEQIMQEFIVNNENQMDKDNQKIVKNNYIFDHLNDIQPLAAPQISAAYITIQLESSDIEQVFYNLNSKEIDALNSVRKICKFDVEILYSQLIDLGHVVQLVTEKINSQSINVAITALVCIMELVQSLKRALDPYAGNIIQSGFDSFKQYRNESFMILQMAAQNLNENKILQYIYKSWDYQKEPQNMHQIAILFDIIISKVKEQIINSKEFYTFVRILAHLQVDQSLVIRKLARKILYKLLLTGLNKSKFKENIRLILPEYLYLKMTELIDKQEELEKEVQLNDEKPDEIQLKKKVYIPYNKRNN